jgi:choline dehydrogenase-like flavoprotein
VGLGVLLEPEPGLDHRRNYLPRGRVVGGSSSLNAMIYIRGNRADYDEWAAMGFDGWGYEDVLPYFKRAEDNERGASRYHGVGGPLSVSESRSMHPIVEAWIEAAGRRHPAQRRPQRRHAGRRRGATRSPSATAGAAAPRSPTCIRPSPAGNVDVVTDARVYRILFDGKRAVGVEYMRHGPPRAGPRRARGDPLRGGLSLAAAADALRASGPPEALTPLGWRPSTSCPVGQNLHGPRDAQLRLPDRQGQPDLVAHARRLRALRDGGARAR